MLSHYYNCSPRKNLTGSISCIDSILNGNFSCIHSWRAFQSNLNISQKNKRLPVEGVIFALIASLNAAVNETLSNEIPPAAANVVVPKALYSICEVLAEYNMARGRRSSLAKITTFMHKQKKEIKEC